MSTPSIRIKRSPPAQAKVDPATVVAAAGGQRVIVSRLAAERGINITIQAVDGWIATERIPGDHVPWLSEITGIPGHLIRPDMYPRPKHDEVCDASLDR